MGPNGVYVVPSSALSTTPLLVPGPINPSLLSIGFTGVLSQQGSYAEQRAMYAGVGSDGNTHLYGLNLTNAGTSNTAPQAVQLSSLTLPAAGICNNNYWTAQTNPVVSTTLFAVVEVPATAGGACASTDVYDIVLYSDTATSTTAPIASAINPSFVAIYQTNGLMAGALEVDANNNLTYYTYTSGAGGAFGTFAAQTPLYTGLGAGYFNTFASNGYETELFFNFEDAAGKTELWGVNAAGAANFKYTVVNSLDGGITDANNVYFSDSSSTTAIIYAVPFAGAAAPTQLTSLAVSSYPSLRMIASTGSTLLFTTVSATNTMVYKLAVSGGTPTLFATLTGTLSDAFVDSSLTYLYVTLNNGSAKNDTVLNLSTAAAVLSNSNASFIGSDGVIAAGSLQQSNLGQDSSGGQGGSTFQVVNASTQTAANLTTTAGTAFTVSMGYSENDIFALYANGTGGFIGEAGFTPYSSTSTALETTALFDFSKLLMVPVTIPGATAATVVTPWFD